MNGNELNTASVKHRRITRVNGVYDRFTCAHAVAVEAPWR